MSLFQNLRRRFTANPVMQDWPGLIEAYSADNADGFMLAVQWHPEWKAASNTFSSALFARFAASARERAAERGKDR